ncbi:MAG: hypothetical protein QM751_08110, partial [Paludibacteraceae bacterium]
KDNLNVTAFIAKDYTNEITNVNVLNSKREKLSFAASGLDQTYTNSISLYCKNGKIEVNGEYTAIKMYSIDGKEIDNNNLTKGICVVKVNNLDKLATKKVMVY